MIFNYRIVIIVSAIFIQLLIGSKNSVSKEHVNYNKIDELLKQSILNKKYKFTSTLINDNKLNIPTKSTGSNISSYLPGNKFVYDNLISQKNIAINHPIKLFSSSLFDNKYKFQWKTNIVTTVFWIGEKPTPKNPLPNTMSSWDMNWTESYGGFDDPDRKNRYNFIPKEFIPKENPFYFALPYNDITINSTKESARKHIPWFNEDFKRKGITVLKSRWIAIRHKNRVCYAQWEDVGPFKTNDYKYVFGNARPKTTKNHEAGLDISPAVRDYLGFKGGYGTVDWRFVELKDIEDGPWKKYGRNNHFVNKKFVHNKKNNSKGLLKKSNLLEVKYN